VVNEERVRKKIPELLSEGSLSIKSNLYKYQSQRRKLRHIERKHNFFFNRHVKKVVKALEDFENAMDNIDFEF